MIGQAMCSDFGIGQHLVLNIYIDASLYALDSSLNKVKDISMIEAH